MNLNTLYLQKEREGAGVVDTVGSWGIYVVEDMPAMDPTDVKTDGNSTDWMDEDGLDVYDADSVVMKEFTVEIPMVVTGDTPAACRTAYKGMIEYLTGKNVNEKGTLMKVYQGWVGYGRRGVRYMGTKDNKFWRDGNGYSIYTFTITLEVGDPVSEVVATVGEDGAVSGLTVSEE